MNILLLEDDAKKRADVLGVIREAYPDAIIEVAASVHSGVAALEAVRADVILLDMTMPPFDAGADEDGDTRHFGGREFLRQAEARDLLAPIILVSQFSQFGEGSTATTLDELDKELKRLYPIWYRGAVKYSPRLDAWKRPLIEAIDGSGARE